MEEVKRGFPNPIKTISSKVTRETKGIKSIIESRLFQITQYSR